MESSKKEQKQKDRLEKQLAKDREREQLPLGEGKNLAGKGLQVAGKEDPEDIWITGQQWYLFSFVTPVGSNQRGKETWIKFRGAFATDTEAHAHAATIFQADPDFDIFIFKSNNWIRIPPPKEHYDSVPMSYGQEKLDKIMRGYYDKEKKAKLDLEARVKQAEKESRKKNKAIQPKLDRAREERARIKAEAAASAAAPESVPEPETVSEKP